MVRAGPDQDFEISIREQDMSAAHFFGQAGPETYASRPGEPGAAKVSSALVKTVKLPDGRTPEPVPDVG